MQQDIRWKQRFQYFEKAFDNLVIVLDALSKNSDDLIHRMATIQAYEMVVELGWKTYKDYLNYQGIDVSLPKEVIKEGFASGIIDDGETWINMLVDRNLTSHTYDENKANQVVNDIKNKYFFVLEHEYKFFKAKL